MQLAITSQSPAEIVSALMQAEISEGVLEESIELYAQQQIEDASARDAFIRQYTEARYQPIIRKAVLDVVVSVVAADAIDNDCIFRDVIRILELGDEDEVIAKMQLTMLDKLAEDAIADMDDAVVERYRARINYVRSVLL